MSNPKSRALPEIFNTYLIMLLIYCLDLFFLKSDLSVLGDNFYSRFVSFVILFVIVYTTKSSTKILGITKDKKKILAGFVYGTIFAVVPLIAVTAVECIFYYFTDASSITLRFTTPNVSYIRSAGLPVGIAYIIYFFTSFFASAFKEMFFRGFLLKKLKKTTDFKTANLIQALLYMLLIVPLLLRNLSRGLYDETTAQLGVFIVMFYLIHETTAGIKWGLLTRVTGSTYVAIIDHFLYVFLANSIYISSKYVTWSFMTHMMAIQLVSLGMVLIYYKINMKKIIAKKAEEDAAKEKKRLEKKERKEKNFSRYESKEKVIDKKILNIDSISPGQYKDIVEKASEQHRSSRHHSNQTNEINSKTNEGKLEDITDVNIADKANEYNENVLKNSHHRSHSNNYAQVINSDKIESFSGNSSDYQNHSLSDNMPHYNYRAHHSDYAAKINAQKIENLNVDEIAQKASEYSDSLSIERQTPRHPHPHDKMALDSLLPVEEIEKSNSDKLTDFNNGDIDSFLKDFSETYSKRHAHHSSQTQKIDYEEDDNVDSLNGNFDADDFLKDFQRQQQEKISPTPHVHHHHHHTSDYESENNIASLSEVTTDKFFDEYQKTVQTEKKVKKSIFQTVRDLGNADDSESNDLI